MAEEPPIRVKDLSHAFGLGGARKKVLYGIDLTVRRGELVILMGASGSGKTTLLTLIGCLREVQEGSIRLLGQELNGADGKTLEACRRRLGFIFQAHNLHESLTAIQNVQLGLAVHGDAAPKDWRKPCAHLLSILGLNDRVDHLPANLSGGQKQRVAIARALIGNPDIVLADEPTAALDKENSDSVVAMLKRLGKARGTSILMVTHDARVTRHADRIVVLEDGRIAEERAGG